MKFVLRNHRDGDCLNLGQDYELRDRLGRTERLIASWEDVEDKLPSRLRGLANDTILELIAVRAEIEEALKLPIIEVNV